MRKRNKYLTITITKEIHEKLKKIAEKQGRTVTEIVREAIGKLLMEYEKFLHISDKT